MTIFKSAKTLKTIERSTFPNNGDTIMKAVPPIINPESAKRISDTTDRGGLVMNYLSSSNFLIGIILGGSMQ